MRRFSSPSRRRLRTLGVAGHGEIQVHEDAEAPQRHDSRHDSDAAPENFFSAGTTDNPPIVVYFEMKKFPLGGLELEHALRLAVDEARDVHHGAVDVLLQVVHLHELGDGRFCHLVQRPFDSVVALGPALLVELELTRCSRPSSSRRHRGSSLAREPSGRLRPVSSGLRASRICHSP
jgi:hypothetical protein